MKFCNTSLFPLLKLNPFFPKLFLVFIFLQSKKINALQVLKSFPHESYSRSFYLPTRVGNRAFFYCTLG